MTDIKRKRVVIAGGGTGGHIYPGLAVAKVLAERGYEVHWVGARGGLEEKIVPRPTTAAPPELHLVSIGKLHASAGLLVRLRTVLMMPLAFLQALQLVLRLKPVAVLGVGGFASGPFLFVAALLGYRTVIWEPNAHMGMANRLLAPLVDLCLVVFEEATRQINNKVRTKSVRVGLPVRSSIRPGERPPLAGRNLRVLVFGGSQGARPINRVISQAVATNFLYDVDLVHQTGPYDYQQTRALYESLGRPNVELHEYLHDMEARYQWADLVICRAGASTVAEIAACGKAAVFVPLPTAADNHQYKNASVLAQAGAAVLIEQKDFSVDTLSATIQRFRKSPETAAELGRAAMAFASPNAAEEIARRVLNEAES